MASLLDQQAADIRVRARWISKWEEPMGSSQLGLTIENRSTRPITDVRVFFAQEEGFIISKEPMAQAVERAVPGLERTVLRPAERFPVIAPGPEDERVVWALITGTGSAKPEDQLKYRDRKQAMVVVYFTDFMNNRWGIYPGEQVLLQTIGSVKRAAIPEPDFDTRRAIS